VLLMPAKHGPPATSYTIYPLDDGDLFYEALCKLRPPN
jgi:hypothetical protein